MEKGAKGNENCFELAGVSSYRGFELLGVDCMSWEPIDFPLWQVTFHIGGQGCLD